MMTTTQSENRKPTTMTTENEICDSCKIEGKYARYIRKYDNILCEDCEKRFEKQWG